MPHIYCRQVRTRGLRPDWKYLKREVESALDKRVKPDLLGYFNKIVAPWKDEHRPGFRARKRMTKKFISVWVFPVGPEKVKNIWKFVSITGVKPHQIPIKNAPFLMFRWDGPGSYQARTTRSGGYKGPGVASGRWHKMLEVWHPGFERRRFEWWIGQVWYKKKFYKIMEAAFKRGIRRAKAQARRM